jgi:hypothetical protein
MNLLILRGSGGMQRLLCGLLGCCIALLSVGCRSSTTIGYPGGGQGCQILGVAETHAAERGFREPSSQPSLELALLPIGTRLSKRALEVGGVPVRIRADNRGKVALWILSEPHYAFGFRVDGLTVDGARVRPLETVSWALPACRDFIVIAPGQSVEVKRTLTPERLPKVVVGKNVRIQASYLDKSNVVSAEHLNALPVVGTVKSNIIEIEVTE